MKKANYIVFDCETGGLKAKENPILEIAFVALDAKTLKEVKRWETYIKPYDDLIITKEALAANGLKLSEVRANGVDKKEAVNSIITLLKSICPNTHVANRPVPVGHNVQFDLDFLGELFMRCGKNLADFINDRSIDTQPLAKMSYSVIPESLKLSDVCSDKGVKLVEAHRAMPDTVATSQLFAHFAYKLRAEEGAVLSNAETADKKRLKFQF